MDRFVTRAPTWKTMDYTTIVQKTSNLCLKKKTEQKRIPLLEQHTKKNEHVSAGRPFPVLPATPTFRSDKNDLQSMRAISLDNIQQGNYIGTNENIPPGKLSDYVSETTLSNLTRDLPCAPSKNSAFDEFDDDLQHNNNLHQYHNHRPTTPSQQLSDKEHLLQSSPKIPHTTKQLQQQQLLMARIQHDLNSPSANVRLRAIRAMKSPTKSTYTQFDVPLVEQSIITAEDRRTPPSTPTIQELMSDIIVYVEVRTGEDNRSAGVKKVISALGARVNDKLLRDTTHVIFKDGLLSTYKKAKNWNIPVVSILWIEACKNQRKICDPKDYPISNIDRYENPELYDKMKRHKSMQPDSEVNKRVRVKHGTQKESTPKSLTGAMKKTLTLIDGTPKSAQTQKTDISHYLKTLSNSNNKSGRKAHNQTPRSVAEENVDSPATQLLAKINSNNFTPIALVRAQTKYKKTNPDQTSRAAAAGEANKDGLLASTSTPIHRTRKTLNFTETQIETLEDSTNVTPVLTSAKRVSQRRRSVVQNTIEMATTYIGEMSLSSLQNNNNTPMTRRRRSMCNTNNSVLDIDITNDTSKQLLHKKFTTILEDDKSVSTCKTLCNETQNDEMTKKSSNNRRTIFAFKAMEMCTPENISTAKKMSEKSNNRRRTLYTPQKMEMSVAAAELQLQEIGNTISKQPNVTDNSKTNDVPSSTPTDEDTLVESSQPEALLEENAPSLVFSSTRAPGHRRTMFDMSMDIITHRMHNINQSSSRRSMAFVSASQLSVEVRRNSVDLNTPITKKTSNGNEDEQNTKAISEQASGIGDELNANHNQNDSSVANGNDNNNTIEPLVRKKRKLFMPTEDNLLLLTPPALKKTTTSSISLTTPSSNNKRRKTLMPLTQPKSDTALTLSCSTTKTQAKKPSVSRRRSTLDFVDANSMKIVATSTTSTSSTIANAEEDKTKTIVDKCSEEINSQTTNVDQVVVNESQTLSQQPQTQVNRNLRFMVYTNMHKEQIEVIREALDKLGGFELEKNVTDNTTHVVSLEPRRTLNMLRALVRGLWMLEYTWLLDSVQAGKWLNEEQYELRDFSRAVEICRAERQAFGSMYKCELFRHLGAFYISSRSGHISKGDLIELIKLCGGHVVEQRKRAKYVLGNVNRAVADDKIYITPFWILDSITQMQLLRFNKYVWPKSPAQDSGDKTGNTNATNASQSQSPSQRCNQKLN